MVQGSGTGLEELKRREKRDRRERAQKRRKQRGIGRMVAGSLYPQGVSGHVYGAGNDSGVG